MHHTEEKNRRRLRASGKAPVTFAEALDKHLREHGLSEKEFASSCHPSLNPETVAAMRTGEFVPRGNERAKFGRMIGFDWTPLHFADAKREVFGDQPDSFPCFKSAADLRLFCAAVVERIGVKRGGPPLNVNYETLRKFARGEQFAMPATLIVMLRALDGARSRCTIPARDSSQLGLEFASAFVSRQRPLGDRAVAAANGSSQSRRRSSIRDAEESSRVAIPAAVSLRSGAPSTSIPSGRSPGVAAPETPIVTADLPAIRYQVTVEALTPRLGTLSDEEIDDTARLIEEVRRRLIISARISDDHTREKIRCRLGPEVDELYRAIEVFTSEIPVAVARVIATRKRFIGGREEAGNPSTKTGGG
ncbi:MAG: hypothetical protein V1723_03750 [Candidatus Uhrbacteria bacterium]